MIDEFKEPTLPIATLETINVIRTQERTVPKVPDLAMASSIFGSSSKKPKRVLFLESNKPAPHGPQEADQVRLHKARDPNCCVLLGLEPSHPGSPMLRKAQV